MLLLLIACSQDFPVDTADPVPVPNDTDTDTAVDTDTDTDTDTGELPDLPLELCINEFMADNEASIQDETLAWPDWIELHNPGEASVVLDGWSLTDDRGEPRKSVLAGGLSVPAGGYRLLWADALPDVGSDHLAFKLGGDGGEVALYAPDGRGSIVTYGQMAADFSLTRIPDCCEGDACLAFDFRGTPGERNVEPVYESVPLLSAGATWRYWDLATSPGAGWEQPAFDDTAWASGVGPLGYGDHHVVTTLSYGADPYNKPITSWFRTTVTVPAIEIGTLTLGLLRDDGAVVYLNGVEIARDNVPDGVLTETTLANAAVGGHAETVYWEFEIEPALLTAGPNVLAVELHQSAASSSDLGFDLTLTGGIIVGE